MGLAEQEAVFDEGQEDPAFWFGEILGLDLWEKQIGIAEAVRDHPAVTVASCHGAGKTFTAAAISLWFLYCFPPAKVVTTAPTGRQVRDQLWMEIKRLHSRAAARGYPLGGECLQVRLKVAEDWFAVGISTDEAEQFQGYHSVNLLVVVDEAAGVKEPIFQAVTGLVTTANARRLYIGNPTSTAGAFWRSQHSPLAWKRLAISAFDTPNFQGEGIIRPYLVTPQWVEERREEWGEGSPLWTALVLGEFPTAGTRTLIPLELVELAQNAELAAEGPVEMGVDVARFGDDESVVIVRKGPVVLEIMVYRGLDTMELTGRVVDFIRRCSPSAIKVDEIGIGSGVVDRLREQGYTQVVGINVANKARDSEQFAIIRDEMWFALADRFKGGDIQIPRDSVLMGQLANIEYDFTSRGQRYVEGKDAMKKRGLKSPDRADALALAFYPVHGGAWPEQRTDSPNAIMAGIRRREF